MNSTIVGARTVDGSLLPKQREKFKIIGISYGTKKDGTIIHDWVCKSKLTNKHNNIFYYSDNNLTPRQVDDVWKNYKEFYLHKYLILEFDAAVDGIPVEPTCMGIYES